MLAKPQMQTHGVLSIALQKALGGENAAICLVQDMYLTLASFAGVACSLHAHCKLGSDRHAQVAALPMVLYEPSTG